MAGASSLTIAEVRLIKAMLALRPCLRKQTILSYFTRPGRDLNHRLITEIADGQRWASQPAASAQELYAFQFANAHRRPLAAEDFVDMGGSRPAGASRMHLILLDWWSAGQGLFSSGMISRQSHPVVWVYDCGSSSTQGILDRSLARFEAQFIGLEGESIRLAVLSHFDRDHLSGLVKLLDVAPVRTLLLPYVPAWRRLLVAVEQGVDAEDPAFRFFLDPVAYLADVADGRIGEIVFASASNPDQPPPAVPEAPEDPDRESERVPGLEGDDLKIDQGEAPPEAEGDPVLASDASAGARVRVRFLPSGGRLVVPGLWEFVPYNDAAMASRIGPAEVAAIEALRDELLDDPKTRKATLAKLKALYESIFKTSAERNLISLFLYSGPVVHRYRMFHWPGQQPEAGDTLLRFSQMHTGDGYLNDDARLGTFIRYFDPGDRLARSAILQVMHHGSRSNWQAGVAARLNPGWSIFSSDPTHKSFGHPHAEVLRDFWLHGPEQVDRNRSFHMHGWLLG